VPFNYLNNPLIQPTGAARIASRTVNYPVTSNDNSINIVAFSGVLNDSRSISFPAGSITGLISGESYSVFWNITTSTYEAFLYPASTQIASSNFVFLIVQNTSTAGVFPSPDPTPGGYCVTDDTIILMDGGREKLARDCVVGDIVWTRHEHSLELGAYPITHIEFVTAPIFDCGDYPSATQKHKFYGGDGWLLAGDIGQPAGVAVVAKITVADAHTYMSKRLGSNNFVLSHNVKPRDDFY
jgi:hypothetical protein